MRPAEPWRGQARKRVNSAYREACSCGTSGQGSYHSPSTILLPPSQSPVPYERDLSPLLVSSSLVPAPTSDPGAQDYSRPKLSTGWLPPSVHLPMFVVNRDSWVGAGA